MVELTALPMQIPIGGVEGASGGSLPLHRDLAAPTQESHPALGAGDLGLRPVGLACSLPNPHVTTSLVVKLRRTLL